MSGQVRVALIGAGGIGQAYAQAFRLVPEACLAAIADVSPSSSAEQLAAAHAVPFALNPQAILDPGRIDLALLCTPPATHEDLAVAFLEAGIAVMCEKPLATSRAAGQRMLAAAADSGSTLTMASKFRFVSEVIHARNLVRNGALGEIISADVAFCAPVDMTGRWNSRPEISGGGVLMDNGTHGVDILRFLLGPIESVFASVSTTTPGLAVEDTAVTLVRTAGCPMASVTVSWAGKQVSDTYLSIQGTRGSVEVGWSSSRLQARSAASIETFGSGYDKFRALGGNLRNVSRSELGLEDLCVTGADAMASIDVIEAAYDSIQMGRWASVTSMVEQVA